MSLPCEKCKGTGRGQREGSEADTTLHPILAAALGLCEDCGGSGVKSPVDSHAANRAAAKAMEG